MTHTINIIKDQPNTVEFDVVIEKLEATDMMVRFVVSLPKYHALIECKKEGGDKWSVELPVLPVENDSPFRVEVIASDFFFIAAEGTLTLVEQEEKKEKEEDTKASVSNIEVNPSEDSKEEKEEDKKEEPETKKEEEKKEVKETTNTSIAARKILNEHNNETKKKKTKPRNIITSTTPPAPKPALVKEEAPVVLKPTKADKKVKEVLKSLTVTEDTRTQKPKVVVQKGSIVTITT